MAAVWAVEVCPVRELIGHPLHVLGIHGVVLGADDQRRGFDPRQVRSAVPLEQAAAGAELARVEGLARLLDRPENRALTATDLEAIRGDIEDLRNTEARIDELEALAGAR